jgi:hypothetical protein
MRCYLPRTFSGLTSSVLGWTGKDARGSNRWRNSTFERNLPIEDHCRGPRENFLFFIDKKTLTV